MKTCFRRISDRLLVVLFIFCTIHKQSSAQNSLKVINRLVQEKDMSDVFKHILKNKTESSIAMPAGLAVLLSFGYNPSFGFALGAKAASGIQYGDTNNSSHSSVGLAALYTSKVIITVQAIQNIFTAGNQLNWQDNWQLSKFGIADYGLGSGKRLGADSSYFPEYFWFE